MAMDDRFWEYLRGRNAGFNPYAAGKPQYGPAGAPNVGPVSDPSGYRERDAKAANVRNALLRRLKAQQRGQYGSANAQRPIRSISPGPGGF